jgi:hypothetical protein
MNTLHQINPTEMSNEALDRLAFAIAAKVLPLIDKGDEVFTPDQAADFVKYKRSTFDSMVAMGKFKRHNIHEKADPKFLKSELIAALKAS